jgi:hypothetical protein
MKLDREAILKMLRGEKLRALAEDGMTTDDIMERTGLGRSAARVKIAEMVRADILEFAGHKRYTRIDGQSGTKPAYRLVDVKPAKKRKEARTKP